MERLTRGMFTVTYNRNSDDKTTTVTETRSYSSRETAERLAGIWNRVDGYSANVSAPEVPRTYLVDTEYPSYGQWETDDLGKAVEEAWRLHRATNRPVLITDVSNDDDPRVVATVKIEWSST